MLQEYFEYVKIPFLSSSVSYMASLLVYPIDVMATHIKTRDTPQSIASTAREIYRNDGFRRFYRGIGTVFYEVFPCDFIYISVYAFSSNYLSKMFDRKGIGHKWAIPPFCSTLSIVSAYSLQVPVLTVQTRIQSNREEFKYKSFIDGARQIARTEGFFRLYYASYIYFMFQVLFLGVQYTCYENFKKIFKQKTGKKELSILDSCFLTLGATSIAILACNPFDTLAVRYQMVNFKCETNKDNSAWQILKNDFKKYGFFRGTNRGLCVCSMNLLFGYGAIIPVFEVLRTKYDVELDL